MSIFVKTTGRVTLNCRRDTPTEDVVDYDERRRTTHEQINSFIGNKQTGAVVIGIADREIEREMSATIGMSMVLCIGLQP